MRILFAGTPFFAAEALESLIKEHFDVAMVLSQPDRPAGRGRKLKSSEVKEIALRHGIPVETPLTLRKSKGGEAVEKLYERLRSLQIDLFVVAAYGLILPEEFLEIPKGILHDKYPSLKAINIHGSLLPRWRGAAPIARAIEAGDSKTGITLMQMDAGLDTGPMLFKKELPIEPSDTAGELTQKLARLGARMLIEYLKNPEDFPPQNQPADGTYAKKITKEETKIDWTASAKTIANKIKAFNPVPGCVAVYEEESLKIWMAQECEVQTQEKPGTILTADASGLHIACGQSSVLKVTELQKPGGRRLAIKEFLLGHPIERGQQLQ